MDHNRYLLLFFIAPILIGLSACGRKSSVCPPENGTSNPSLQLADLIEMPAPPPPAGSTQIEIGGKLTVVDKVVDYPLCNDEWSGIVYVSCDVHVADWDPDEGSRFLEGCALNIDPGTVVFVAEHNDKPHYKGCTCHTGEVYEIVK